MKFQLFLPLLFLVCFSPFGRAQDKLFSVEGSYQGKNLFVNNPPQSDGFGYCVSKVSVNGDILPASIQNSSFEVDFSLFNLKIGDPVYVVLEHAQGCAPSFINPEVLLPKSTFVCTKIKADKSGTITWETKDEKGSLDFIIEQYRWNRWVEVGQVKGTGKSQANTYTFQMIPCSGENKIRVSQIDNSGEKRSSSSCSFVSAVPKVKKSPSRVTDNIYFKASGKRVKTKFEIYDAFGNLLKVGFSDMVDCTNLLDGVYFINFDNSTEKFIKTNP